MFKRTDGRARLITYMLISIIRPSRYRNTTTNSTLGDGPLVRCVVYYDESGHGECGREENVGKRSFAVDNLPPLVN